MAKKCGECRRYHTNRYHESICGLTGKNVGFLWEEKEDCFEPLTLPEAPAAETRELTSDDNKSTQNDNKMAQNANKMENTPILKVCKECGRELPIEKFQIIGRHKAVNSICKECQHKKAAATRNAKAKAAEDELLEKIFGKKDGEELMRADLLQARANDVVQLLNIYNARCDGDWDKRDKMKKALLNFKPNPDVDLESIRKYYNFKW